jgi:3-hydroxybutyryl-CoA dehydrogenase
VLQGVCDTAGADAAMKLGVNYPAGPFEWLAHWSVDGVVGVLRARCRIPRRALSRQPWLRRRAHRQA